MYEQLQWAAMYISPFALSLQIVMSAYQVSDVLYDPVSVSHCIASNGRMIGM